MSSLSSLGAAPPLAGGSGAKKQPAKNTLGDGLDALLGGGSPKSKKKQRSPKKKAKAKREKPLDGGSPTASRQDRFPDMGASTSFSADRMPPSEPMSPVAHKHVPRGPPVEVPDLDDLDDDLFGSFKRSGDGGRGSSSAGPTPVAGRRAGQTERESYPPINANRQQQQQPKSAGDESDSLDEGDLDDILGDLGSDDERERAQAAKNAAPPVESDDVSDDYEPDFVDEDEEDTDALFDHVAEPEPEPVFEEKRAPARQPAPAPEPEPEPAPEPEPEPDVGARDEWDSPAGDAKERRKAERAARKAAERAEEVERAKAFLAAKEAEREREAAKVKAHLERMKEQKDLEERKKEDELDRIRQQAQEQQRARLRRTSSGNILPSSDTDESIGSINDSMRSQPAAPRPAVPSAAAASVAASVVPAAAARHREEDTPPSSISSPAPSDVSRASETDTSGFDDDDDVLDLLMNDDLSKAERDSKLSELRASKMSSKSPAKQSKTKSVEPVDLPTYAPSSSLDDGPLDDSFITGPTVIAEPPTSRKVQQWTEWLGLDAHDARDRKLMYLAKEGAAQALPKPWRYVEGHRFFNPVKNVYQDQHPLVALMMQHVASARQSAASDDGLSSSGEAAAAPQPSVRAVRDESARATAESRRPTMAQVDSSLDRMRAGAPAAASRQEAPKKAPITIGRRRKPAAAAAAAESAAAAPSTAPTPAPMPAAAPASPYRHGAPPQMYEESLRERSRLVSQLEEQARRIAELESARSVVASEMDAARQAHARALADAEASAEQRLRLAAAERETAAHDAAARERALKDSLAQMEHQHREEQRSARKAHEEQLQRAADELKDALAAAETRRREQLEHAEVMAAKTLETKVAELESIIERQRRAHAEELEAFRRRQASSAALDGLSDKLAASASAVDTMRTEMESERSRTVEERELRAEERERLLNEREAKLMAAQTAFETERVKLQQVLHSTDASMRGLKVEHESERTRLHRAEDRMNEMQVALAAERAEMRSTLADERRKLELDRATLLHDREVFLRERQEDKDKIARERTEFLAMKQSAQSELIKAQQSLMAEEARVARLREEAEHNRAFSEEGRAVLEKERVRIQDELVALERAKAQFKRDTVHLTEVGMALQKQSAELVTDRQAVEQEHAALEAKRKEAADAVAGMDEAKARLAERLQEIKDQQKSYESDRLEMAKERKDLMAMRKTMGVSGARHGPGKENAVGVNAVPADAAPAVAAIHSAIPAVATAPGERGSMDRALRERIKRQLQRTRTERDRMVSRLGVWEQDQESARNVLQDQMRFLFDVQSASVSETIDASALTVLRAHTTGASGLVDAIGTSLVSLPDSLMDRTTFHTGVMPTGLGASDLGATSMSTPHSTQLDSNDQSSKGLTTLLGDTTVEQTQNSSVQFQPQISPGAVQGMPNEA